MVVADDPVAFVSARIARPHHPDRVRRLMDHMVVDRRQRKLFVEMIVADGKVSGRIGILHPGLAIRAPAGQLRSAGGAVPPRCTAIDEITISQEEFSPQRYHPPIFRYAIRAYR